MKLFLIAFIAISAGCSTTPRHTVADDLILERVYCGLTEDITYGYDPQKPVESDTLETVEQIIAHNAVRERLCTGQENAIPLEAQNSPVSGGIRSIGAFSNAGQVGKSTDPAPGGGADP